MPGDMSTADLFQPAGPIGVPRSVRVGVELIPPMNTSDLKIILAINKITNQSC